jgi:hypothetical protein
LTLIVSAARRRWGGRRVLFAPAEPPGGLSLCRLCAARNMRSEPGGPGGCAPRCKCGLCPPRGVCLTDVAVGKACRLRELFGLVWPGRA